MVARSVLITGCNRGLGLEFVKQFVRLNKAPECIFAACRNPLQAEELNALADQHRNVHILEIDVGDHSTIDSAAKEVSEFVGDDGLNVLINNAGQMQHMETKIKNMKVENLRRLLEVNTVGPTIMTQTFLPLIRKASLKQKKSKDMSVSRAAILNMTGILASFDQNTMGGSYSYRLSKVAMNMLTKNLSVELKRDGILAVNLHPGWVRTDLGGKTAPIDVTESISGLMKLLPTLTNQHNGTFQQWDGTSLKY